MSEKTASNRSSVVHPRHHLGELHLRMYSSRQQPLKGKLLALWGEGVLLGILFLELPMKTVLAFVAVALVAYATVASFAAGTADNGVRVINARHAAMAAQ